MDVFAFSLDRQSQFVCHRFALHGLPNRSKPRIASYLLYLTAACSNTSKELCIYSCDDRVHIFAKLSLILPLHCVAACTNALHLSLPMYAAATDVYVPSMSYKLNHLEIISSLGVPVPIWNQTQFSDLHCSLFVDNRSTLYEKWND